MISARRVTLGALARGSAQRAAVRANSTQLAPTKSAESAAALRVSRAFTTKSTTQATPIVQALALDRFGRARRVEVKVNPTTQHSDRDDVLLMAKWAAGLLAAGACLAGATGENGQAHAAGTGGNDSSTEDVLAQIKKKLQAFADENLGNRQLDGVQKQINDFLASGKGGQISWGFMMGACSGFALKKVSKLGAIALGSVFIMFQCASYAGYINVNHKKIEQDVLDVLDINHDGQFNSKDVDEVYKQVMKVLEYSMPAGSGFAVGFLVGFRAG